MSLKIVPVTEKEIDLMVQQMHQEDRDSIWALYHDPVDVALRRTLALSVESHAAYIDDDLVAIYGVTEPSLLCEWRCVWFVGTDNIKKHPKPFLRYCRILGDEFIGKYKWTKNFVDARNTTSIRWLKWLGFTIHPAVPLGVEGRLFHMNELRKQ